MEKGGRGREGVMGVEGGGTGRGCQARVANEQEPNTMKKHGSRHGGEE